MNAINYKPSAWSMLLHCALDGVTGWGSKRRVWVAFSYNGEMLTWSANKRHCRLAAGMISPTFVLCKLQGIEP